MDKTEDLAVISKSRVGQRMERARKMLADGHTPINVMPALMDGETAILAKIESASEAGKWYAVGITVKEGLLIGSECGCPDYHDTETVGPAMHRGVRVCKHTLSLAIYAKRRGMIPSAQPGASKGVGTPEYTSPPLEYTSAATEESTPATRPLLPEEEHRLTVKILDHTYELSDVIAAATAYMLVLEDKGARWSQEARGEIGGILVREDDTGPDRHQLEMEAIGENMEAAVA